MKRARLLALLLLVVVGVGFGMRGVQGQEPARPAPWPEIWATHPLNTSAQSIGLPMIASEDTYLWSNRPGENFGNLDYGEIGPGKRALFKFNLAEVPTQGSLPIQGIHLAIALVDTVPNSFWLGVAGTCTPWQENTATWNNANCYPPFALTLYPDTAPHWEFIDLWRPGAVVAENGYILFDTSNALVARRFLTREAGDEWAPRLIVSYSRDTQPPALTAYGGPPSSTTLMVPDWAFDLSISEDAGLRRIYFERQMKSTGVREEAVIEAAQISQQLRLEPAVGCARNRYESTLFTTFPFPDRPLGNDFRYQIWLEDCLGKRSEPLVFEHLVHVERIEYASLRDFNDQPLEVGSVMRKEDRGTTELTPASIQYGYGETGHFGSISDSAEYWVNAPNFPAGSEGVLEGERINSSPAKGIRLFVPWYDFETIRVAGLQVKKGTITRIPLRVPLGEQVIIATVANTTGETSEEDSPGGMASLGVEDATGTSTQIKQVYVSNNNIFVTGELTQWAGEVVTLTLDFSPNNGREWAMRLNEIVVSAQNPDLSVDGQALALPVDSLRAGVPLPIDYQVGLVRATQPTTLTLEASLAVTLSDFSVQPSAQFTQTDRLRYEWVMAELLTGSRVLTATATIDTPGSYALDLSIANLRDPFLANNQAQIQLIASQNIVYLPSTPAP